MDWVVLAAMRNRRMEVVVYLALLPPSELEVEYHQDYLLVLDQALELLGVQSLQQHMDYLRVRGQRRHQRD